MNNIVEIVEQAGIELTEIGEGIYRGFCPFHDDKNTPNFTVYRDTNSTHCYSCGKHCNDAIDFISAFYKISREEAIQRLAFDDEWLKKQLSEKREIVKFPCLLIYAKRIQELLKAHPDRYREIVDSLKSYDETNIIEKYNQVLQICGGKNEGN